MTCVMKVPIYDKEGEFRLVYSASKLTPTVVETLEQDSYYVRFYNVNKRYHFDNEQSADIFLHIIKQIIMLRRYDEYFFYRDGWKEYNDRKNRSVNKVIDLYPNNPDNGTGIQELDLAPESEQRIFYHLYILSEPYSYDFIVDEKQKLWCTGWNNKDIEKYARPGKYKIITKYELLIEKLPEILFQCPLLDRLDKQNVEWHILCKMLLPGFADYYEKRRLNPHEIYPYDKLQATKRFYKFFAEWYEKNTDICCAKSGCPSERLIAPGQEEITDPYNYRPHRPAIVMQGAACRDMLTFTIKGDDMDGIFPYWNVWLLKNYKKVLINRSNRREFFRQKHGIKR